MAKTFSFEELAKSMSKVNDLSSILSESDFSKIDEYIPVGNYAVNAQLTGSIFGGIPNTRSVAISGESGTGKTYLCLNACREAQRLGYNIIYCDTEAAVDDEMFRKFGVDPDRVIYEPIKTITVLKQVISNLYIDLKEKKQKGYDIPKLMLVLDSLGNMATDKERNDASTGSDKKDMTKQSGLRSLFRIITQDLAELKIPFIFTNHTYAEIGQYVPSQKMAGGGGPEYAASMILMLQKAKLKETNKEAEKYGMNSTGIVVTSKLAKSRFVKTIPVKFHISFISGMNPFVGLEKYCSWDTVGIGAGRLEEIVDSVPVLDEDGNQVIRRGKPVVETRPTGEYTFIPDESDKPKTFAVRHLGENIKASRIYTKDVFTEEILKELDEKVIKKVFLLPSVSEIGGDVAQLENELYDEDIFG